jgi:hypothetical protein
MESGTRRGRRLQTQLTRDDPYNPGEPKRVEISENHDCVSASSDSRGPFRSQSRGTDLVPVPFTVNVDVYDQKIAPRGALMQA